MSFKNATILLPAVDETYSLKQTADIICQTCLPSDISNRFSKEN